jgi:hypothetical protein
LPRKVLDCLAYLTSAELLDRFFEQWVTLTDDLVKHCSPHPSLLKLLERASRFHALVLARVADEDHPILGPQPFEEIVDLPAARQARFVDDEQPRAAITAVLPPRQVILQGSRTDARLREFVDRAGGRRQTLDGVAVLPCDVPDGRQRCRLAGAGGSLETDHLVSARQDFDDSTALGLAELRL